MLQLLLCVLLACCCCEGAPTSHHTACLSQYKPLVDCINPMRPTGFEVELFRRASQMVPWTNFSLVCMPFDQLIGELRQPAQSPNKTCSVHIGGLSVMSSAISKGARYSLPTYEGGRGILVYDDDEVDIFFFLRPFLPSVWICVFGSAVMVAIVIMVLEVPLQAVLAQCTDYQWWAAGMLLQGPTEFPLRTAGARIVLLGYAFMILIVINMYIAVLSSRLTVTGLNTQVRGFGDLPNKRVGVFEQDEELVARLNLRYHVRLPWSSDADEASMIERLKQKEYAALVVDRPFAQFNAATDCSLRLVGETLLPQDLAYAFSPGTNESLIDAVNIALADLKEAGVYETLQNQFITPGMYCPKRDGDISQLQIGLENIGGLWGFLGSAIGAGIVCNLVTRCTSTHFSRHKASGG